MSRSFRIGLRLGLLGGVAVVIARTLQSRRAATRPVTARPDDWPPIPPAPVRAGADVPLPEEPASPEPARALPPQPEPAPASPPASARTAPKAPKAAKAAKTAKTAKPAKKAAAPAVRWVEPSGSACPETHPVKAKLSSGLFHPPGAFAYNRTTPDRCYESPEAAEADGLTRTRR